MRLPPRRPLPDLPPIDIATLLPPFAPVDAASEWLFGLRRLGIRPGLEGIRELLVRLGHPERRLRCVVVAGTNGKGTASTYLAALCRSAGLRTALYTSPHLLAVTERMEIDGEPVAADELAALVEEHRDLVDSLRTTFFESLTGLALLHFARRGVEVAVLEAGLGGRLDATNAVEKQAVVLTSVGLDHQELLGDTLAQIAREKLGLAQPGVPFYLPRLPSEIHALAIDHLQRCGAIPILLPGLLGSARHAAARGPRREVAARGWIQREQAPAMAACYADLASRLGWPAADPAAAYGNLRLPCRFEIWGQRPELVVDTAHNEQALLSVLGQWSTHGHREGRVLVLASMRGKTVTDVMVRAVRTAATVIVTAPHWYRAVPPGELAAKMVEATRHDARPTEVLAIDTVREALERARDLGRNREAAGHRASVLVTGSHFLVAEALDRLGVDDLRGPPVSALWSEARPLRRRRNTGQEMTVS